jgi:carboxymethylenebutenolidase
MIELTAGDGRKFSAYRADPEGTPKGAVVVVQDFFGLNTQIRKIADDFAAKGYLAIAPSLFDSVKPEVALGYDEGGLAEGVGLTEQIGTERAIADIQQTVDAVRTAGKVTIVGYGWGGYLAYLSGNRVNGVACTVGYYGDGIVADYRGARSRPAALRRGRPRIPSRRFVSFGPTGCTSAHFRIRRSARSTATTATAITARRQRQRSSGRWCGSLIC